MVYGIKSIMFNIIGLGVLFILFLFSFECDKKNLHCSHIEFSLRYEDYLKIDSDLYSTSLGSNKRKVHLK